MKKNIHPKYHKIKVEMTDGTHFETKSTYSAIAQVYDDSFMSQQAFQVLINNLNEYAPQITSSSTFTVNENQTSVGTVTASDADLVSVSYSISGTDADDFEINSNSGILSFKSAPDYESKSSFSFKLINFNNNLVTIVSADVPMKNLKTVLKALYLLKQGGINAKLTILGDLREDNNKLIDRLGLTKEITYKSKLPRKQLIQSLNNADIGIAPSKYEGFGFPLVEMIATGLPVIVSDKASLPELAGNAGLIFNSSDSNDLKEKMKELIENAALRNKVAENSKLRRDDFQQPYFLMPH